MAQKRTLSSVADIVEAFGGTKAVAEWADVGMSAVSNWIVRDEIPPGWHYRLDRELRRRGYKVDPPLFGDFPPVAVRATDRCGAAVDVKHNGSAA